MYSECCELQGVPSAQRHDTPCLIGKRSEHRPGPPAQRGVWLQEFLKSELIQVIEAMGRRAGAWPLPSQRSLDYRGQETLFRQSLLGCFGQS